MYCFYPSLDAEKGAVQVFSYVPEFILDFLYSVEIEQWRKVSDGKSLQGKQEDKGKDNKTRKSGSNVTLADFLKSEMRRERQIGFPWHGRGVGMEGAPTTLISEPRHEIGHSQY